MPPNKRPRRAPPAAPAQPPEDQGGSARPDLAALHRAREELRKGPETRARGEKRDAVEAELKEVSAKLARTREEEGIDTPAEPTGFAAEHQATVETFARANDVVVMWRPVHPEAAAKLEGRHQTDGALIDQFKGKALNVKGKSSVLPPLSADVPADVRLSKVQRDQPEKVPEYQEKNDALLRKSNEELIAYRQRIAELQAGDAKHTELLDLLHEANEAMLAVAENAQTSQGNPLFYVTKADGELELTQTEEPKPVLLEQREDALYQYNYETNLYDTRYELPEGNETRPAQRLAYVQFTFNPATKTVEEKPFPITADYDELASTGRKIYPFLNNREGIRTRVTAELYSKLAHHRSAPVDPVEIATSVVLEYELEVRRQHRERKFIKGIGIADDLQWASKVFLKGETEGATNHGAEVDSPFPQPITEDRYPVFLPSGQIVILHNEQELCDFINQQRAKGFLLDVNPKWGWEMDETEKLFIPEQRFDWETVHNGLREQQISIEQLEYAKSQGEEINVERLEIFTARNADDVELMNIKVEIERLKLEPPLIYSPFANNYLEEPAEDEEEKAFRLEVQDRVRQGELEVRHKKIAKLSEKYQEMKESYAERYDFSSLIDQQDEKLLFFKPVSTP